MANTATQPKARSQAQNGKKDPVHSVRPGNGISIGIYEGTLTRDGKRKTVYSATMRKAYVNKDGELEKVQTLYPSDFLMASHGWEEAYRWVRKQYESDEDE